MIWIAIAIIIAGYLIAKTLENNKKKELELKQKELEANPEYRRKKQLELKIEQAQRESDMLRKFSDKAYKDQLEAEKKGDKKEATNLAERRNRDYTLAIDAEKKIDEYNKQLTDGKSLSAIRQPVYRYNFEIIDVHLTPYNFRNSFNPELQRDSGILKDEKLKASLTKLKGIPISIVLENPKEWPRQGVFFAKSKAEDKGSEIVATLLGTTFIGNQRHQWDDAGTLAGKFVYCKLLSIEQLSI